MQQAVLALDGGGRIEATIRAAVRMQAAYQTGQKMS